MKWISLLPHAYSAHHNEISLYVDMFEILIMTDEAQLLPACSSGALERQLESAVAGVS